MATLYLNIDLVIKGGSQRQADNIFYEVVLQKCRVIEAQPSMGVVGLYSHKDREESSKIYDPKLLLTL
jgi:hypothetical protein